MLVVHENVIVELNGGRIEGHVDECGVAENKGSADEGDGGETKVIKLNVETNRGVLCSPCSSVYLKRKSER
jgi:hypothetical protein